MNQHAQSMAQYLAQESIRLGRVRLAVERIPAVHLDHPDGRLNEGAPVVVFQERLAVRLSSFITQYIHCTA